MRHALPLLLFALTTAPAAAQVGTAAPDTDAPASDPRVSRALDAAGLKHEVDRDGDYRVLFERENGRTQLVLVNTATETLGDLEVREVWSVAHRAEGGELPGDLANRLLQHSFTRKLGAWVLNGEFVAFVVRVDADASGDVLSTVLHVVSQTADDLEEELTAAADAY